MNVLVVGPYPPSPGHEAAATFALVRDLIADGHTVRVASPVPSAAHEHLDPGSPRGALHLRRLVRGHDRVVVRIDAASLLASSDAPRLRPGRIALAAALRGASGLQLIVDRVPVDVSRKWVSAVVGRADSVVVGSDDERAALVAAGASAARIEVQPATDGAAAPRGSVAPWSGTAREALQRDVRRRAAAVRERHEPAAVTRHTTAAPLREIAPLGHAPVGSPKPGVAFVKRLVAKLVGWQLDPIIQHVNRLHQATVASIEQIEPDETP